MRPSKIQHRTKEQETRGIQPFSREDLIREVVIAKYIFLRRKAVLAKLI